MARFGLGPPAHKFESDPGHVLFAHFQERLHNELLPALESMNWRRAIVWEDVLFETPTWAKTRLPPADNKAVPGRRQYRLAPIIEVFKRPKWDRMSLYLLRGTVTSWLPQAGTLQVTLPLSSSLFADERFGCPEQVQRDGARLQCDLHECRLTLPRLWPRLETALQVRTLPGRFAEPVSEQGSEYR